MARLKESKHYSVTDNITGEISSMTEERDIYIKKNDEPPYIKIYFEKIALLHNITNSLVLFSILKRMDYNNNISVDFIMKQEVMEECNVSKSVFEHVLTVAVKNKLFFRRCRGRYVVNFDVINKGKWDTLKNKEIEKIFLTCEIANDGSTKIITTIKSNE